jgi:hypothetical protein
MPSTASQLPNARSPPTSAATTARPIIIGRYARTLHERGDLREGITLEQARDVLWTISPPELYELLVLRRGRSVDRFVAFQAEQSIAAVLPLEAPLWE